MPRKVIQEEEPELVWDKKKLIVAGLVLLLIIAGFVYVKYFFLSNGTSSPLMSVKGASTDALGTSSQASHKMSLPSQEDIQGKITQLEEQVTHLSVKDVATSSPQVQQVLKQLQELPSYPATQAKDACMKLCSQL